MASGLLDGSIASPARALSFGPYREALRERGEGFREAYAQLDDEELQERMEAGRRRLADELAALDKE